MAGLLSGLGGLYGFGSDDIGAVDDETRTIDGSAVFAGVELKNARFDEIVISPNGWVTLGPYGDGGFRAESLAGSFPSPIFAPFWFDHDLRLPPDQATAGGTSTGSGRVWYDLDEAAGRLTVTWDDVGRFDEIVTEPNAFQAILTAGNDERLGIEFRYEQIAGLDSFDYATAGFNTGDGAPLPGRRFGIGTFELPGSGDADALMDLDTVSGNTGLPGLWSFFVEDEPELSPPGPPTNLSDVIEGDGMPQAIDALAGNDLVRPGGGGDILTLGDGRDAVSATLDALNGLVVTDFTAQDEIWFEDAALSRSDARITISQWLNEFGPFARIEIGDTTLELQGAVFDGDFMFGRVSESATPFESGTADTHMLFQAFRRDVAETRFVESEDRNGVASQAYLSGATAERFEVTVQDGAVAAFRNALGVYEITPDGSLVDVRWLVTDSQAVAGPVQADGVDPENLMGLFLASDAASRLDPRAFDSDALSLEIEDGNVRLSVDDEIVRDVEIFLSHDSRLNPGYGEHYISGAARDGSGALEVGIEDQVFQGDADYNDVLLRIEALSAEIA